MSKHIPADERSEQIAHLGGAEAAARRRLSPNTLTREQAIEKATALARAEMDKLDNPE